jgi:hypothetical protein
VTALTKAEIEALVAEVRKHHVRVSNSYTGTEWCLTCRTHTDNGMEFPCPPLRLAAHIEGEKP